MQKENKMVNNNTQAKKKWSKVGTVRKSENGGFYIKLEKDVSVTVNGQPLTSKNLSLQNPVESRKRLLASGKAKDSAKLEAEIEQFQDGKLSFIVDEIFITE